MFLAGYASGWGKPSGDLNEDCAVNWLDIDLLCNQWLNTGCSDGNCADLDGVSGIDFTDLAILAANWRKTCSDVQLVINEVQADNEATIADPQGDYDDWIEIYNNSPITADVGGLYVTDDLNDLDKWRIPDIVPSQTSIPPYGFLLLWADNDTGDGPTHVGFGLGADGEQAGLVRFNGTTVVDSVTFGPQDQDQSCGRWPDAAANWLLSSLPTPGEENAYSEAINWVNADQGDCVVVFNEIMYNNPVNDITLEWVELHNQMAVNIDLSGWSVTDGIHYEFPSGTVIPGWGYLVVAASPNDLHAETGYSGAIGPYEGRLSNGGEKVCLRDNSGRVMDVLRYDDEGDWNSVPDGSGRTLAKIDPNSATWPAENWKASSQINGTAGTDNGLAGSIVIPTGTHTAGSIVINEIMYHHQPTWEPYADSNEEWIELYNRSGWTVILSNWRLADAVQFKFPSVTTIAAGDYLIVSSDGNALKAKYPAITSKIKGNFTGKLANGTDRIRLYNDVNALIDEVRYCDGKPWPAYADGGGSSIELKDPDADNTRPEAWADSNERQKTSWKTYTYQATAAASVGPDAQWNEFIMGLLDAGEILIDDVNVLEDPCGTRVQFIQNQTFEPNAAYWRLGGNHSHSQVVIDPNNPANHVLDLVATGQAEQIYNHAETTIAGDRQTINGNLYKVSFRAKWLAGNPRLNTRLYFNRIPKTMLIDPNQFNGTPGARNSCYQSNIGPTYNYLAHSPVVPTSGQSVTVTTVVKDPDGINSVKLYYRIGAGSWSNKNMTHQGDGRYIAIIDAQPARTIVQFYIQATDTLSATSTYPAAGASSRALYKVKDGKATSTGLHNFRIIMNDEDFAALNQIWNTYTDDLYGATVIYDENQPFYDVGVCFKGSLYSRGSPDIYRKGYKVEFAADKLFRGVTESLTIDRAASAGCGFLIDCDPEHRTREIFTKHIMNRIGGVATQYDDLCQFIPPDSNGANHAQLQIGHYNNRYLDSFYEDGSDGMIFKHELIYYPRVTIDGNVESPKDLLNYATAYYPVPPIDYLGDNGDYYRQIYLVRSNRDSDDFSRIIQMANMFELTGPAFIAQAEQMLDLDQWMRAYAWTTIISSFDNYFGSNTPHNHYFFIRPSDNKICFLPWDNDFLFETGGFYRIRACDSLNAKLFADVNDRRYRRLYYGHLYDILTTVVNADYLTSWAQHFGALIPEEDYVNYYLDFQIDRADWIMTTQLPAHVAFEIITNNGNNFSTSASSVVIEGNGWIDIRTLELAGYDPQPAFLWVDPPDPDPDMTRWRTTVGLAYGANVLQFNAYDFAGNLTASDSITVTRTGP